MSPTCKQLLALVVVSQLLVSLGTNFGLNSVAIIQVSEAADQEEGASFVSTAQLLRIVGVATLGQLPGGVLAAAVAPPLGVRRLLLIAWPLNVAGALAAGLGHSFWWVLIGRTCSITSFGLAEGTVRGFIGEIAPANRRAVYSTLATALVYTGQLVVLIVGPVLNWQYITILATAIPAVLCLLGLVFLPNSPRWLLAQKKPEAEARRALEFYNGKDIDIDEKLTDITESLQSDGENDTLMWWRLLMERRTLQPLLLASGQMTLFAWSGGVTLVLITAVVLEPLQLPLTPYQAAMMQPLVCLVFPLLLCPWLERCGRLPLLRLAGTVSTFGCTSAAVSFLLPEDDQQQQQQLISGWLLIIGAVVVQVASSSITAPLSFNYCSELLPTRTRTLGANVIMAVMSVNMFVLLMTFPLMQDSVGLGGIFMLHALVSALQVLFATCCLHETAGLTLEQVQRLFENRDEPYLSAPEIAAAMDGRQAKQ